MLLRDLLLFSCYTGAAYVDVVSVTKDNLVTDEEGSQWLKYYRHKTKALAQVKLLPEAINLIEKYKDVRRDTLMPYQKYKTLWDDLRKICKMAGTTQMVSPHMGRHYYASIVTLAENDPIDVISKMLGHTNITQTQVYARVTQKKLFEEAAKFAEATKDANALQDLIKRAEINYQTLVNEQGVASAELLKNSLNGTLPKTQNLMEISEEEREKLKARCETIRSIETYKGSNMLFASSATVFRMICSIYKKGIAHEEDTHGSFRLLPYHPNWNIDVYNLEMIIHLAYAIDSDNSHKFRKFIMKRMMGKPMYENVCITIHMDDFSKKW